MAKDIMGPDFAMIGMLVIVMLPGDRVIAVKDALAGFSNEGLLTVAGVSAVVTYYYSSKLQKRPSTGS